MPAPADEALFERETDLARLDTLLEDAREGRGRLLMIEGPAGIGKTRLVAAARDAATASGIEVLSARGGDLESDFVYGVVRQLFEPPLRRATPAERDSLMAGAAALAATALEATRQDSSEPAVLHGLYWLT